VEGENVMTAEREAMQFDHGRSQKAERRQLKGLWWAFVLIWAGLIFGAESLDLLPQIGAGDVWSWIFTGAGLLGILGAIYRVATSDVPSPTTWDCVW
jgi:amino acid transporter